MHNSVCPGREVLVYGQVTTVQLYYRHLEKRIVVIAGLAVPA